jgi:hypothetical protein
MAKYLVLWHLNLMAPWPTDPAEGAKLNEMLYAAMDDFIKMGRVKEFGWFLDGKSGYTMIEGESIGPFTEAVSFFPFILKEVHEILPYETGKETLRGVMKARAEAAKK